MPDQISTPASTSAGALRHIPPECQEADVNYIAITTNEYSDLLRKEALLDILRTMYRRGSEYKVRDVLDSVWGSESDA